MNERVSEGVTVDVDAEAVARRRHRATRPAPGGAGDRGLEALG